MSWPSVFAEALQRAIGRAVIGTAVVDREGKLIDWVGAAADDEKSSVGNLVTLLEQDSALASLLSGEVGVLPLVQDELFVVVAVAACELWVIAVVTNSDETTIDTVRALRNQVSRMLPGGPREPGASGAGPAELQVTELGVTVPRKLGNQ